MTHTTSATVVPEDRITAYHVGLFLLCFLGNTMGGILSTLMSVYLPDIVRDVAVSGDPDQVGAFISMIFFVGWAVGGLIWGVFGDRIGRVRALALSIIMFGVFTMLMVLAGSWETVILYRFFTGFGVGGMLVLNTTLFSETWPGKTRAISIGILSIGFPVGIFSAGLINYFVTGWRQGFAVGVLPVLIGLICLIALRESDLWRSEKAGRESLSGLSLRGYRADLIKGSVIFGSMLVGLWAIFSWVPTWVQSIVPDANSQRERSVSMMLLGIGGLSGGFVSGWLSNRMGVRRTMLMCFAGCFILSFLLFYVSSAFSAITLAEIVMLAFLFGISQGLLGVYIPLLFPVSIRATATGFCFNIGRFLTAAAVFFVGSLVSVFHGYSNSLFAFSWVFLVGFLILFFQKNVNVNVDGTH